MGIYRGLGVVNDGLVFGYDTGYPISDNTVTNRFNQGKPSTNLVSAYNDNHVRHVTWTNSGTWEYDHNATNNTKPIIPGVDMSKCNLMHGKTVTTGSQHFGCGSVSVSGSTTYSMSVYYFQNKAGISQPYFRTNVNNNNLGNLAYNGSTDTNNWPVNEWIRISVTVTVQSNETGCYLSNYIGSAVGDQVWYCAPMVEQDDQTTPFVDGTRSVTASLIDLKRTRSIDVSNASFDSTGQIELDGTDDNIDLGSDITFKANGGDWTVESVVKYDSVPASYNNSTAPGNFIGSETISFNSWYWSVLSSKLAIWNLSPGVWKYGSTTLVANKFYHVVLTCSPGGTQYKMYLNGVQEGGTHADYAFNASYSGLKVRYIGIGKSNIRRVNGKISVTRIYDTALTSAQIAQNYQAYKNRFNI